MTGSSLLVEPAFLSVPPFAKTLGPEVADVAALAGLVPDENQAAALDAIFAMGSDNKVVALEAAIIASRQNLKSALFEMCALGWLFVTDQQLVTWSAHEFDTAQEAHRHLADYIEDCPALSRRLRSVHHGAADKSIELLSGQRVKFKARTNTGSRGLSGDKLVLDEAFALLPAHMGSLFPTMSARPDPQVVYGSSAGHVNSGVLRSIRDRGRKGGDPSLIYIEYCDDLPGNCANPPCDHMLGRSGCRLDDERRWFRSNPALGRRITLEYVRSERRAIPVAEFGRERLGWWDEDPSTSGWAVIPQDAWHAAADPFSAPLDPVAFAVGVTPDRNYGSIAVAGVRADGWLHIELVDRRPGTEWIVDRLAELDAKWVPSANVVDEGGPAGSLIGEIELAGMCVLKPSVRQVGQAAGQFHDAIVHSKTVRHMGQDVLDRAVAAATKRPLGDAWTWGRENPDLVAVSLALWGLTGQLDGGGLAPDDVYVGRF